MDATAPQLATDGVQPGSFVLTQLDVYDWGAFGGRHRADIDARGTAIIGPTGSGKTTLVDALMTLLTANPRYNLASTGGHESDRDLMSYVRGVSGAGNQSGDNQHVARSGPVTTGLAACFSDGTQSLRIGALLWTDGSSSAIADLKRRWMFCVGDEPNLDVWLQTLRAEGVRGLKRLEGEAPGLKCYEDKKGYLARLRSFFEVGENAFSLLNRAAGLKQLNSIDEVFRDLVLDDTSKFSRASEVADEFNILDGIHAELETARRQRESLLPIERDWALRAQQLEQLEEQQRLKTLIPRWFGAQAQQMFDTRRQALQTQFERLQSTEESLQRQLRDQEEQVQMLQGIYLQAGGSAVEHLQARMVWQTEEIERKQRQAHAYQARVAALGWDEALDELAFVANQARASALAAERGALEAELQQQAWTLGVEERLDQDRLADIRRQLSDCERLPGSNLPPDYLDFRADLARHLGCDPVALPFVGELVEVKPDEAPRWRGAIERAIGQHRMRVLCDPMFIAPALAWINQRHNRLDVRVLEALPPATPPQFLGDGFTRKLNFKPHPLREALKQLLAGVDRHCVDTPEQVRQVWPSMTDQGLMSSRPGQFDKLDKQPLASNWMTGFDNRDRVADLRRQLLDVERAHALSRDKALQARTAVERMTRELRLLEAICALSFAEINVPGAEQERSVLEQRIAALTSPESGLVATRANWEGARTTLAAAREQERANALLLKETDARCAAAEQARVRAAHRAGKLLDAAEVDWLTGRLPMLSMNELDQWDDRERAAADACQIAISDRSERLRKLEMQLVRSMGLAKTADTGALSEVGSDVDDAPHYLERLRVLVEEALPEKQRRFVTYLNQSSDQGVTQLLSDVENEVSAIEERIHDLNRTLRRVDFQPGRYLQLEPRRVVHESLRTLDQAQRALRSAALREDQGESHYRALRHMVGLLREAVDKRKTLAARALLDPRHRLQFAVSVIERNGDVVVETRTSSQGGSGGEKEIIASYVLTASLSYALCPRDSNRPTFATIVLDEAFSKSSHAVAGRIIRALEEFGLHPLFVTPNKELRLLRMHTRSAILIHRKGLQATMTSLSWEALASHASLRASNTYEVAG
jgi:uncharacterized protein YPO0396